MIKREKQKTILLLGLLLVFELIIYLPQVGTGFVKDDFAWLSNIVINGKVDYLRPFTITTGFFRPLVSWTFGVQYELHGMNPGPYGWFNLFLHLVNILLVYLLLSSAAVSRAYALWAAALFGLNAKGPPMAVGWISGRTTLLVACFMLLSLYLYLETRQQHRKGGWSYKQIFLYFLVGVSYFAALLAKETAAAVPIFVFLASFLVEKRKSKGASRVFFKNMQTAFLNTLVFLIPLTLYFFWRLNTNAIIPFNAPDFYRYTMAPMVILKNLCEYITRAGMLDILIIAWLLIVFLFTRAKTKPPEGIDGLAFTAGSGWFLCFLLPTLLIPARSDIYVYVPQVGLHLATLTIIFYLWKRTGANTKKRIKQTFIFLPIGILILAYIGYLAIIAAANGKKGNHSFVFTQQVLQRTSNMKPGDHVFIIDMEPNHGFSPGRIVSYGITPLLNLYYPHKRLTGKIIPPESAAKITCDKNMLHFFFWGNGHLAGPFSCSGLKTVIYFLYPYSCLIPQMPGKPEKPGSKRRLYRLKKRKMRLKQQLIRQKQNGQE
ncbi:MAG: hypothetical protein JSV88_29275 [Candidatus Aminicenantes bacterium]|nr:MAG: hypothetical protein JSV88_29275 [Candidatus Aminicenantes bacterium]